jgi:hypothetical protein
MRVLWRKCFILTFLWRTRSTVRFEHLTLLFSELAFDHRLYEAEEAAEQLAGDGTDEVGNGIDLPRPVPVQGKYR